MIYTGYADFWFRDIRLPERVAKFASLGIRHIDVWAWRSKGALMDEVAAACRQHGSVINSTFDEAGGSLTDANDLPLCLDAWAESLDHAQRWGAQHLFMFSEQINTPPPTPPLKGRGVEEIQGWVKPPSRDYTLQQKYANLLDGAARVMELVEKTKVVVWFEALNTYHLHGGITVCTHELAADVVRRINHPQLRLAFDCYHQQRTAGNLIQGLHDYWGLYDSVHIGDVPTRQEPGTGEINFANIARALQALGFDADGTGKIGLEFTPSHPGREQETLDAVRAMFDFNVRAADNRPTRA
jgi:hydroxypyruvate isomerase